MRKKLVCWISSVRDKILDKASLLFDDIAWGIINYRAAKEKEKKQKEDEIRWQNKIHRAECYQKTIERLKEYKNGKSETV